MSDSTADRDPIEMLADSFLARFRRGERPSVEEYAAQVPRAGRRDPRAAAGPGRCWSRRSPSPARPPGPAAARPPTASGAGPAAAGRLPDPPRDRPGRHGRGLRGGAAVAGPARGAQGAASSALAGSSQLERFRLEARAAARLHHTNIVPVFGVGEQRRRALLRHAVHPGPGPGCCDRRRLAGLRNCKVSRACSRAMRLREQPAVTISR